MCSKFNEIWWEYFLWFKDDPPKILKYFIKYWLNWSVFSQNGQILRKFSKSCKISNIDRIFKNKIFKENFTQFWPIVKFLFGLSNENIEKIHFKKLSSKIDYRCAGTLLQKMA